MCVHVENKLSNHGAGAWRSKVDVVMFLDVDLKKKETKTPQRLPVMVASVVPACAACVHVEDNRSTHGVGACGQLMNVV